MAAEMAHIFLTDAHEMLPPACVESADYFAALVARARAGDEIAFERIMLATEQRVVSIAWRMLGNRDDARDAAQDVYLRVFKYLAGKHPERRRPHRRGCRACARRDRKSTRLN